MHDDPLFVLEDHPVLVDDSPDAAFQEATRRALLSGNRKVVTVAALQDIFRATVADLPTPLGEQTVADLDPVFTGYVIGWNAADSGADLDNLVSISMGLGFLPAADYPVCNFYLSVDDGAGEPFLVDYNFALHTNVARIRLYQLLAAGQCCVLCFADGQVQPLCFKLGREVRDDFLTEVRALWSALDSYPRLDLPAFGRGVEEVCDAIRPGCFPMEGSDHSLELYHRRCLYTPAPVPAFWGNVAAVDTK